MIARALTIAGSDPTSGAGIQQDLRTFAALGVWGMSAITAVTVQDTTGVDEWEPMTGQLVAAQVGAALDDVGADAIKTGMLATVEIVGAVGAALARPGVTSVVVDPVLGATSGGALIEEGVVDALRAYLLPRALVVTPNSGEAATLSGVHVDDVQSQIAAARALRELGARAAIVTGGHITGDRVVDVLVDDAGKVHELEGPRIGTQDVHGTGCVFSAALTGHLANGVPVVEAARKAKGLVSHAIARALKLGRGALLLDPRAP